MSEKFVESNQQQENGGGETIPLLGAENARNYVKVGQIDHAVEIIKASSEIFESDMAYDLIENGRGWDVVSCFGKFPDIDHSRAVLSILENDGERTLQHNRFPFENLSADVADKLIATDLGFTVAQYLDRFVDIDHASIADRVIDLGYGKSIATNFEKFKDVDHVEIANKLIEKGLTVELAFNLKKFKGLTEDIRKILVKENEMIVNMHTDSFV